MAAMKRKRLLLVLAALAALAVAGTAVLWPRRPRVTREKFDRIREGMTRADVEAILGPPGDYRNGPTRYEKVGPPEGLRLFRREFWWYDDGTFDVGFDGTGRIRWSVLFPARRVNAGALDNLRWRAKRQWRRWPP
jgi:hypothetical protein